MASSKRNYNIYFKTLIPIIIFIVIYCVNLITDIFILSNNAYYWKESLGAIFYFLPIYLIVYALSTSIIVGSIRIINSDSKDNKLKLASLSNAIFLLFFSYLFIVALLLPFMPAYAQFISGDKTRSTVLYLNIYNYSVIGILSIILIFISHFVLYSLINLRKIYHGIIILTIQLVVSISVSIILLKTNIFSSFYATNHEASATLFGSIFGVLTQIILASFILMKRSNLYYRFSFKRLSFNSKWIVDVSKYGYIDFLIYATLGISILITFIFFKFQSYSSNDFLDITASSAIVTRINLMFCFIFILISRSLFEFFRSQYKFMHKRILNKAINSSIINSIITGFILFVLVFYFKSSIAYSFTNDEVIVSYVTVGLFVLSFSLIFLPLFYILIGIFNGINKYIVSLKVILISNIVILTAFGISLLKIEQICGLIIYIPLAQFISSFVIISYYLNLNIINKKE